MLKLWQIVQQHMADEIKMGTPAEMMREQAEHSVPVAKVNKMSEKELEDKIVTGILTDIDRPECRAEYQKTDRFSPKRLEEHYIYKHYLINYNNRL